MALPREPNKPLELASPGMLTIIVIAFWALIVLATESVAAPDRFSVFRTYGLIPDSVADATSFQPAAGAVVTALFLHGGWLHFVGNAIFLFVFGSAIEPAMGRIRLMCFYVVCGAVGVLAHVALNLNDLGPVLGPSAAVAGVLAAYLMLHPKTTVLVFRLYRLRVRLYPHILLLAWIVLQIFEATTARGPVESVTAPLLVAGFIAGLSFVIPLRLPDVPLLPAAEPEEDTGTHRRRNEQA